MTWACAGARCSVRRVGLWRVAFPDADAGFLEVDVIPVQEPGQLAKLQARQGSRQVDDGVLLILFFSERLLGCALGGAPRTAVAADQCGGDDQVNLLRRIEVEAGSLVGVLQQVYLVGDVLEQFVMTDRDHRRLGRTILVAHGRSGDRSDPAHVGGAKAPAALARITQCLRRDGFEVGAQPEDGFFPGTTRWRRYVAARSSCRLEAVQAAS